MRERRLLIPLVAVAGLLFAGCGDDDDPGATGSAAAWPGDGVETQPYDLGDGLVAELPEGWEVTPFDNPDEGAEPPCSRRWARVSDGETSISLELNSAECAGIDQDQIGNGSHGIYVSIDDVPEPVDVQEHTVAAGALTTFTQEYFECTNSCTDYQDNVGLLAFTTPPDADHPTLVILDSKGERSPDDLVPLADAIHPA